MKAHDIVTSTVSVSRGYHFPGGIRGYSKKGHGWVLSPVRCRDGQIGFLDTPDEKAMWGVFDRLGLRVLAMEEITDPSGALPFRQWLPLVGRTFSHEPAGPWGGIAYAAHRAGDLAYMAIARRVAACCRAAGLQLRNASIEYELQLQAALERATEPNRPFTNLALIDLYLACHSALAEMAGMRDHLASIAARGVGAPAKIDALNRLRDWAAKPVNEGAISNPLLRLFLPGSGGPDWLDELTEYRNLFLHREPMATGQHSNRAVVLERDTAGVTYFRLEVPIESPPGSGELVDALDKFSELFLRLCELGRQTAELAAYEPARMHFTTA